MGKIIANFNMSGGVGKSTSTQNLGFHMANDFGANVLLVDCDPQGSLTTFMGVSHRCGIKPLLLIPFKI